MALVNFSGLASGIDFNSLIDAQQDQERKTRINPLETQVSSLSDTNDSFGELKSLLEDLSSAAQVFRTLSGGVLAKTATSSNESVVTASATNGATNGTYSITVSNKAQNATFSF